MKNSPRYLTKSRFKLAAECPTKLYYSGKRDEYYDTLSNNEFLAMLAEGGYQVGELAKYRYPEGIEIEQKIMTLQLKKHRNIWHRKMSFYLSLPFVWGIISSE